MLNKRLLPRTNLFIITLFIIFGSLLFCSGDTVSSENTGSEIPDELRGNWELDKYAVEVSPGEFKYYEKCSDFPISKTFYISFYSDSVTLECYDLNEKYTLFIVDYKLLSVKEGRITLEVEEMYCNPEYNLCFIDQMEYQVGSEYIYFNHFEGSWLYLISGYDGSKWCYIR